MRLTGNAAPSVPEQGKTADKDAAISQALAAQAMADARARIVETPILWTLDVADAAPGESGIYANAAASLRESGAASLGNAKTDANAEADAADLAIAETLQSVTLIVYGWSSVEPGTLAWVFPTVRTALSAARAMRNAIGWAIVSGDQGAASGNPFDLAAARERGEVLVEQPA